MSHQDNKDRAARAASTIQAHMRAIDCDDDREPCDGNVVDLIADLYHWCEENGVYMEDLIRSARSHHVEELNEAGGQTV